MMDWLSGLFGDNAFFTGGLSLMLIGGAAAAIRFLPGLMWQWLWRRYGIVVTIRDQAVVRWIGVWLAETDFGKRLTWIEAAGSDDKSGFSISLRPGPGLHRFRYHARRIWLTHDLEDSGIAGKISTMSLRVLNRDRATITKLMREVADRANDDRLGKTAVWSNDKSGWWSLIRLTPQRSASTVFLRFGLLERIFDDADWFFQSEPWYRLRGIPYRRGYLLHGSPGNGKSTIVQALAAHCGVPVYALSVTEDEMGDNDLARAVGRVPPNSLVVLEDIEKIDFTRTQITMAGLLNAIDGPLASETRIFIATANDVTNLSQALLRPGRVDRTWEIGVPSIDAIDACLTRFGVDGKREAYIHAARVGDWSMARLQSELMSDLGRMLVTDATLEERPG